MTEPRRPKAMRIDHHAVVETTPAPLEHDDDLATLVASLDQKPREADYRYPSRSWRWFGLFMGAIIGLLSLALGLAMDDLVRNLFARNDYLGWIGLGLVGLLVLTSLLFILRELLALARLRTITHLHDLSEKARTSNKTRDARLLSRNMIQLYRDRPDMARARSTLQAHQGEIIDGANLVDLVERDMMTRLDAQARSEIIAAAKRVSVVTAISPRAIVDLLFVLAQTIRLIRRLSALYGGRPGFLGLMRLTKLIGGHLAITGGIAAGDSLIQQVLGHGLAAKLSARLGEGIINGLMTARIGIAAIEVCRPMPFHANEAPKISDILAILNPISGDKTNK